MVNNRRIKLRYAHAGGHNPPIIVIHGNQTGSVPAHYVRYLEKAFRRDLALHGTPVKIELRGGENPFADRKNKMTQQQLSKQKRLAENARNRKIRKS